MTPAPLTADYEAQVEICDGGGRCLALRLGEGSVRLYSADDLQVFLRRSRGWLDAAGALPRRVGELLPKRLARGSRGVRGRGVRAHRLR